MRNRGFAARVNKGRNVKLLARMLQHVADDGGRALAEHVTEHAVELEVGNRQAVLGAIFLPGCTPGQLLPISAKVAQLPNRLRRDKAAAHEVVFEQVGDPHGIFACPSFSP